MSSSRLNSVAEAGPPARVATPEDAAAVSVFLLQPDLFGTPLTPGERGEFENRPAGSIGRADDTYWFLRDGQGAVCAVIGIRMNQERTGIYEVSALAVHSACRRQGLGRRLLDHGLRFVAESGGRGMLFETSSDPSYAPMHRLLDKLGFKQVGLFPDFYYPGEDTLWYYQTIKR